jgi:hypothetical protein
MEVLDLVTLTPLMERTRGRPEVAIGLIDGPIVKDHVYCDGQNIRVLSGARAAGCSQLNSVAFQHGTFAAGMPLAKRSSTAPAICPGEFLLARGYVAKSGQLRSTDGCVSHDDP